MGYIWIKFGYQLDHNAPNSKLYARAPVFAKRSIAAVPGTYTVCARRVNPAWGSHGQHVLTTGRSSAYFGAAFSVVIWRAWRKDQIQRTGQ